MAVNFTLPPDTRAIGTGDPPQDMNAVVDALTAMGATGNVLNGIYAGGADPTGVADSTEAIAAALEAAAPGQPVYLPAGTYKTTAPIDYTAKILLGASGWPHYAGDQGAVLKPAASFSGAAVLTNTCTSGQLNGGQLLGVTIDGSSATGPVDGILATGNLIAGFMENVFVYGVPGNGIDLTGANSSGHPYGWHLNHVRVDTPGGHGFVHGANHTDAQCYDCQAINSVAGHAWYFSGGSANSRFVACRGEWAGAGYDGFHLSGTWNNGTGAGPCVFSACSTDRNDQYGMNITAQGNAGGSTAPIVLSGCMFRRDGRNGGSGGGSLAGLNISSATMPVVASGIAIYPGVDDNGTGTESPQIGLNAASSSYVQIDSGWIHGATSGYTQSGNTVFSLGPNVITATGATNGPTIKAQPFSAVMNAASLALQKPTGSLPVLEVTNTTSAPTVPAVRLFGASGGDGLLTGAVTGDAGPRFLADTNGKLTWGSGSATGDVDLYRSAAGVLTTDESLIVAEYLQRPGTETAIISEADVINTGTETTLVTLNVPTGSLIAGTTYRCLVMGTNQCTSTSGTLTWRMYMGASAGAQVIQMASQGSALGPNGCWVEMFGTVRTTGTSGTFVTHGRGEIEWSSRVNLTTNTLNTATVNTTAATPAIAITAQWATANAANSLKVSVGVINKMAG